MWIEQATVAQRVSSHTSPRVDSSGNLAAADEICYSRVSVMERQSVKVCSKLHPQKLSRHDIVPPCFDLSLGESF